MLSPGAPIENEAGAPSIEIDLQPISVGSSTTDLPDGPQQTEAESRAQSVPAPPVETQEPPIVIPPNQQQDKAEIAAPVQHRGEAAIAPPDPRQNMVVVKNEPVPQNAAPPPSAPRSINAASVQAALPTPGELTKAQARLITNWQRSLVIRLEQEKRYPQEARGASGIVTVAFTIDRQGRVVSSHITKSSGSQALDAATLALIQRAQPFPAAPTELQDSRLSFVVPIRYVRADEK